MSFVCRSFNGPFKAVFTVEWHWAIVLVHLRKKTKEGEVAISVEGV